jgi:two-component system KDP operon response regulator KdpE
VVEDDLAMRRYLCSTLSEHGLRVIEAESAGEALAHAAAEEPNLVLLEHDVPEIGGIGVTTKLRESTAAPILVLSTRHEESEIVAVLDAGANDYLTKPFSTGELLARIHVWLRHTRSAVSEPTNAILEVGTLRIDFAKRLAFLDGVEVRLTPTQYKLFAAFMRNAGKVMTHREILLAVWGPAYVRETQYLRVFMGRLRKRFEADPARPRLFVMEPGVGYRLRIEN